MGWGLRARGKRHGWKYFNWHWNVSHTGASLSIRILCFTITRNFRSTARRKWTLRFDGPGPIVWRSGTGRQRTRQL